jgi:hypothetical protein
MKPLEYLPLNCAAATAYETLADRVAQRDSHAPGLLDVVAIALAACMPIYGARGDERLARLDDAELFGGTYCNGATRLEFSDGRAPYERLAVTPTDFEEGLERLKRAGVNFSEARFEPARRRKRIVVPA